MASFIEINNEELERFLEVLPNPAVVVNRQGRIVQANSLLEDILGYRQHALISSPIEVLLPEDRRDVHARFLQQYFDNPKTRPMGTGIDLQILRNNGTTLPVDISLRPIYLGDELVTLASIRDISVFKQQEARIRQHANRAEVLARTANRLNAQLDLHTVLRTVCEETANALDAPVVSVFLYDSRQDVLQFAGGWGIPSEYEERLPIISRFQLERFVEQQGSPIVIPDMQNTADLPGRELCVELDLRSSASAVMRRDSTLVGVLTVVTISEVRHFNADDLDVLEGLANQAAQAITNARLFEGARRRLERIQSLHDIDTAIMSSLDVQVTLSIILEQVVNRLLVDAADILLLDPDMNTLEFAAGRGFRTTTPKHTRLRLGEGLAGHAALEKRIVHVADLSVAETSLARSALFHREEFVSYYAVPLIVKGKTRGVLEIFHRSPCRPDEEWHQFLETLAVQTAIGIENAELFVSLQKANQNLIVAYDATIEGWSRALDLRDRETEGHTRRVTDMTLRLAREMGIDESEIVHIRRGALLHDIGKMGVPDSILLKPGPLTEEEWDIMRQHPQFAYDMLSPIRYLRPALDIPYFHHEKWDGSGYPHGLKGEEIPLPARIFAVVDVYDALTSERPYRPAWPKDKALAHIKSGRGTHFDPQVVDIFLQLLQHFGENA